MECRLCSAQLSEGSNFCHRCGVPLEGSKPPVLPPRNSRTLRVLIAGTAFLYFIAWLVAFESFEAGEWVSVAAAVLAVLLLVVAIPSRNYWALLVAVSLLAAWAALFALRQARVNVMEDTSGPWIGIGVLFLLAEVPFVWLAWVKTPVLPSNPSKCRNCGYLLYGLTEARCPECGTPCDWFPPLR